MSKPTQPVEACPTNSISSKTVLYHEKQSLMRCGTHALNNLFQTKWILPRNMEVIATRLATEAGLDRWHSPYKSVLPGLGQYDVMVIVEALKGRGARMAHHVVAQKLDKTLGELRQLIEQDEECHVRGLLINRSSHNVLSKWMFDGRHWLSLIPVKSRRGEGVKWVNVDSKLSVPILIGGLEEMLGWLRRNIESEGAQAFLVVDDRRDETDTEEESVPDKEIASLKVE